MSYVILVRLPNNFVSDDPGWEDSETKSPRLPRVLKRKNRRRVHDVYNDRVVVVNLVDKIFLSGILTT